MNIKLIKCRNCSYQFDPKKEGNSRKRKCGMCCFGDSCCPNIGYNIKGNRYRKYIHIIDTRDEMSLTIVFL